VLLGADAGHLGGACSFIGLSRGPTRGARACGRRWLLLAGGGRGWRWPRPSVGQWDNPRADSPAVWLRWPSSRGGTGSTRSTCPPTRSCSPRRRRTRSAVGSGLLPERPVTGTAVGKNARRRLTLSLCSSNVVFATAATIGPRSRGVWAEEVTGTPDGCSPNWQVAGGSRPAGDHGPGCVAEAWRVDAAMVGGARRGHAALPGTGLLTMGAVGGRLPPRQCPRWPGAPRCRPGHRRVGAAAVHCGRVVLGLYALATRGTAENSTAAVCACWPCVRPAAAGSPRWPDQSDPTPDRVGWRTRAGGASRVHLTIACGHVAWLGGAPGSVLVAVGTAGHRESRARRGPVPGVAARCPATAAPVGPRSGNRVACVASRATGTGPCGDFGAAALLVGAAAANVGARAFELSGSGMSRTAVDSAAVGAYVDDVV